MALAGAAPGLDAERVVGPDVSSCAIDDGARLLLFDPLSVPEELLELAADREPVVLTAPWHERDTQSLVGRLACRCSCRRPTLQTTTCGSRRGEADLYAAGDRLPIGIEACLRGSTTTLCSGSRVGVRSSPAMRWSTSVAASRSGRSR